MKRKKGQGQPRPNRAKKAEAVAILARKMEGQSVRRIAKEMRKGRDTVAKVLNSAEIQAEVEKAKSRIFSLVDKAIAAIETALDSGDAAVAIQVLRGLGVLQEKLKVDSSEGSLGAELERVLIIRSGPGYVEELSRIDNDAPELPAGSGAPVDAQPGGAVEAGGIAEAPDLPLRVLPAGN